MIDEQILEQLFLSSNEEELSDIYGIVSSSDNSSDTDYAGTKSIDTSTVITLAHTTTCTATFMRPRPSEIFLFHVAPKTAACLACCMLIGWLPELFLFRVAPSTAAMCRTK